MSIPNPESEDERTLESDDLGDARSERPDWLMGAAEGAALKPAKGAAAESVSAQPLRLRDKEALEERPKLRLVEEPAVNGPEATAESTSPPQPEAWKAASSSVPKLRQKPAVPAPEPETDSFAGFTQDGIAANKPASKDPTAEPGSAEATPADPPPPVPLGGEMPLWLIWLDYLRFLRHPAALIVAAVVITGLFVVHLLAPKVQEGESVARIRQQPEAYEGRSVTVGGTAGESYALGPNTAFNLYQGRDTIVVYSPLLHPRLHEKVRVTGTISVGYLDGVPRITLLDDAKR